MESNQLASASSSTKSALHIAAAEIEVSGLAPASSAAATAAASSASPASSSAPSVFASFEEMGLPADLLRGIYAYGFEKPSSIQQRAIVPIMRQRDVVAQRAELGLHRHVRLPVGGREKLQKLLLQRGLVRAKQQVAVA